MGSVYEVSRLKRLIVASSLQKAGTGLSRFTDGDESL